MNKKTEEIISYLRSNWYFVALIILGVVLMILPLNKRTDDDVATVVSGSSDYAEITEQRIEEMLLGIEGAGSCEVTITLANSGENIYIRENGSVLVIKDKNGNEVPVLRREELPQIAGVTIASIGAESKIVASAITEAVSTVLGIGSNKICVVLKKG